MSWKDIQNLLKENNKNVKKEKMQLEKAKRKRKY